MGWGCLKKCGDKEFGGYGANSHDYWEKPEPEYKPKYGRKYVKKWPHCSNLGACMANNTAIKKAEELCDRQAACTGFSFTAG